MSEKELFNWLFVVTRNQYCSKWRQFKKHFGGSLDGTPIEELNIAAPDADHEGSDILKRFLSFIEQYSESRQRVIRLWLEQNTLRDIAKALQHTPFQCSHVTVSNWVSAAINAFRESLGVESPETAAPPIEVEKRVRVRNLKQSIAG